MIIVFSSGRSGTNLVLEVLTSSKELIYDIEYPEDKMLFRRNIIYPNNYLTKCDSIYVDGYNQFEKFMLNNNHCKMLWTVRNPYDWILSKLYNGRKKDENDSLSDDATLDGAIADLYYMFSLYLRAIKDFKDRILVVKMEDIILNTEQKTKEICEFTKIQFNGDMLRPYERMRHEIYKQHNKIITDNVDMWKRIDTIYNGFFHNNKEIDIRKLFLFMEPLVDYFKYESSIRR